MIPNGDPMTRGSVLTAILACCIVSLGAVGWSAAREVRQARAELEQAEAARGEAVRRWHGAETALDRARGGDGVVPVNVDGECLEMWSGLDCYDPGPDWLRDSCSATPMTRVCAEGFCSRVWSGYVRDDPGGTWTCGNHLTESVGTTDSTSGGTVEWATSAPWAWEPEWTMGTNGARTDQGRYPIWLGRDRLAGEIGRVDSQIVVWDRHGKVAARLDAACGECGR